MVTENQDLSILDNFQSNDEFLLWLFPDTLKGATVRFLFESFEILKNKKNEDWLVWIVRNEQGERFRLSHYTIFSKGKKIPAKEIHLHTYNLTQDMNNKTKFYMVEELEKVIPINMGNKKK